MENSIEIFKALLKYVLAMYTERTKKLDDYSTNVATVELKDENDTLKLIIWSVEKLPVVRWSIEYTEENRIEKELEMYSGVIARLATDALCSHEIDLINMLAARKV